MTAAMSWLAQRLIETHVQVLFLAAVILVIEACLRGRLNPRLGYLLWSLVLIRLLVPTTTPYASPWTGLFAREDSSAAHDAASRNANSAPVAFGSYADRGHHLVSDGERSPASEMNPRDAVLLTGDAAGRARVRVPASMPIPVAFPSLEDDTLATEASSKSAAEAPVLSLRVSLLIAWLAFAALLLARFVIGECRFRRRLALAPAIDDPIANRLLASCSAEIGYRRRIVIVEFPGIGSPAVVGSRRPLLLMPPGLVTRLEPAQLRYVFLHEILHLRHRDPLKNALVVVLTLMHGFNPVVWFAARRWRAHRESVRDWQVLTLCREGGATSYAETFMRIVERHPAPSPSPVLGYFLNACDLKRRIMTIQRHRPTTVWSWSLGCVLIGVVGWLGFTSVSDARVRESGSPETTAKKQDADGPIVVLRNSEPSKSVLGRREDLNAKLDVEFQGGKLDDALAFLAAASGANIVISSAVTDADIDAITIPKMQMTVASALDLLLDPVDVGWSLVDGVVFVAPRDELRMQFDLRFYRVARLVDVDDAESVERVLDVVQSSLEWTQGFDRDQCRIRYWNGILAATLTEVGHTELEHLLNQLLSRGAHPSGPPAWLARRNSALENSISIDVDTTLGQAAEQLSAIIGVPVIVHRDVEDRGIHFRLHDTKAASVLKCMADGTSVAITQREHAILLNERPDLEVRVYDLDGLVARDSDTDSVDAFLQLIDDTLVGCDYDGCKTILYDNLLVLVNTAVQHERVATLLASLRRATH